MSKVTKTEVKNPVETSEQSVTLTNQSWNLFLGLAEIGIKQIGGNRFETGETVYEVGGKLLREIQDQLK